MVLPFCLKNETLGSREGFLFAHQLSAQPLHRYAERAALASLRQLRNTATTGLQMQPPKDAPAELGHS